MYCTDLNALLHRGHVDESEGGGVAQLGPVLLALHLALLNLNIFAFMLQIILILTFIENYIYQVSDHDHDAHALLPHQAPELGEGGGQGALGVVQ